MKSLETIREKKKEYYDFIEKVKKEMLLNNVYYKKAKFQCFADETFTYSYSNHSFMYEFSFICEDILLDKLTIKELLELKNVKFFRNRIFSKHDMECIATVYVTMENV
jgi:hypothetical protein